MRVLRLIAAIVVPTLWAAAAAFAAPPTVGVLTFQPMPEVYKDAFRKSLREQGFADGKDIKIDWRTGDGTVARADQLAADLVKRKVNVIVASLTPGVTAATKATKTIPIVMAPVADPFATGFVKSLAHPGGNVTGISNVIIDLSGKQLGLLREIQPNVSRVAVLLDSRTTSAKPLLQETQAAAAKAGVHIIPVWMSGTANAAEAFKTVTKERAQAILIQPILGDKMVAGLAREHRVLSVVTGFSTRTFVQAGGLIGYGSDPVEHYQRAGVFVAKILRGANPGDLPVEQATTFELILNMKTAKALGVTIPKDMLVRANEVID